ncbi:hypothetical protein CPB84DRAFT_1842353 [Gymnopilus junonius]|uniref:Uncharacterized protein n=1 Tax=Gymnopilus junonius TaxID=109634 RepID=A0A9P5TSF0_GYMJU|nr:hypothetical protein CPB84DRAFT_1842353 [Gymnopilus junonius]
MSMPTSRFSRAQKRPTVTLIELEHFINEGIQITECLTSSHWFPPQAHEPQKDTPTLFNAKMSHETNVLLPPQLYSQILVPFNTSVMTPSSLFREFENLRASDFTSFSANCTSAKFPRSNWFDNSHIRDTLQNDDRFNLCSSSKALLPFHSAALKVPLSSLLGLGQGLGISGVTRKDELGPFDGLGLLSIQPSAHGLVSPHD